MHYCMCMNMQYFGSMIYIVPTPPNRPYIKAILGEWKVWPH